VVHSSDERVLICGVVCCAVQLCPQYPHNPYTLLNDLKSPAEIVEFGELSDCLDGGTGGFSTRVVNPTFDYITPELVSLFITDT
jgi:translation initiation factor eIF-2B subunit beta